MSGIAGIIHFDGRPVAPGLIDTMTSAMSYRGSDGINHWVKNATALGHCLFRTTPESLEERQPLTNEDESLVLTMDGRVDNWVGLRSELIRCGAVIRTGADPELVLRAYEIWGTRSLRHIEGDFSFVIWDARRRTVFCARDRTGNKPFYYWHTTHTFVFASDFHAILTTPASPRVINDAMVAEHLAVSVTNLRETLIKGVNRLPPAHHLIVSRNRFSETRYWHIDCHATIRYRHPHEYSEHFLDLFSNTVKRQMRSTGDVGVYLSGGIDSSAVACVAARLAGATKTIRSYSLVFPGQDCDEQAFIERVNESCSVPSTLLISNLPPFAHYVTEIAQFLDICDGPNGAITAPLRHSAKTAGAKVILDGTGADEWFGPSPCFYASLLTSWNLEQLFSQLLIDLRSNASARLVVDRVVRSGLVPLLPRRMHSRLRRIRNWGYRKARRADVSRFGFVSQDLAKRVMISDRLALRDECTGSVDPAHREMHRLLHLGWNVRGIEINERVAASQNIEERSPFNSKEIIEFAFALPEEQKSKNVGKHVLRESMKGTVPEDVRSRHSKADFSSIVAETLLNSDLKQLLSRSSLAERGWVDPVQVQREYDEFASLYKYGSYEYIGREWPLWMVVVLEAWMSVIGANSNRSAEERVAT